MKIKHDHPLYPGAIVLADPKYPDQRTPKIRPLLVISSSEFHSNTQYAVCLGITTNPNPDPYLIQLPRTEVQDGHLAHDSQVMCNRMATLQQSKLRKIAVVTPGLYNKILKKVKRDVIEWASSGGEK